MKLKPAEGRAVRDPVKRTLLPADGDEVTLDAFWRRRLRDGDVLEVTDAPAPAATGKTKNSATAAGDANEAADAATTGASS